MTLNEARELAAKRSQDGSVQHVCARIQNSEVRRQLGHYLKEQHHGD